MGLAFTLVLIVILFIGMAQRNFSVSMTEETIMELIQRKIISRLCVGSVIETRAIRYFFKLKVFRGRYGYPRRD